MTERTTAAYMIVLQCVACHIAGFQPPSACMLDYKPAIHAAFEQMWPQIALSGCWFHYCQAIYKQAVTRHNLAALLTASELAKRILKMLMALPRLPNNRMDRGLASEKQPGISESNSTASFSTWRTIGLTL